MNRLNPHHKYKFVFWATQQKFEEISEWLLSEFGTEKYIVEWSIGDDPNKIYSAGDTFERVFSNEFRYMVTFNTEKSAMYFKLRWI